jgi:hypothetical protein
MKKISEQQISEILGLSRKYNIGVNDFIALQTMLEKLPIIVEPNDSKKEPKSE